MFLGGLLKKVFTDFQENFTTSEAWPRLEVINFLYLVQLWIWDQEILDGLFTIWIVDIWHRIFTNAYCLTEVCLTEVFLIKITQTHPDHPETPFLGVYSFGRGIGVV